VGEWDVCLPQLFLKKKLLAKRRRSHSGKAGLCPKVENSRKAFRIEIFVIQNVTGCSIEGKLKYFDGTKCNFDVQCTGVVICLCRTVELKALKC